MLLEDKFLYSRVLETDGRIRVEPTFAGAVLMVLGVLVAAVVIGTIVFAGLSHFGVSF